MDEIKDLMKEVRGETDSDQMTDIGVEQVTEPEQEKAAGELKSEMEQVDAAEEPTKKSMRVIILCVILAVLLLAVGLAVHSSSSDDALNTSEDSQVEYDLGDLAGTID